MNGIMRGQRGREEDANMQFNIVKKPLTMPQFLGYAAIILSNIFFTGVLFANFANKFDEVSTEVELQKQFIDDFKNQNYVYRLVQLESSVVEQGRRSDEKVDRLIEKQGQSVDALNDLKADVRVLGSKVEGLTDNGAKPLNFKPYPSPVVPLAPSPRPEKKASLSD